MFSFPEVPKEPCHSIARLGTSGKFLRDETLESKNLPGSGKVAVFPSGLVLPLPGRRIRFIAFPEILLRI